MSHVRGSLLPLSPLSPAVNPAISLEAFVLEPQDGQTAAEDSKNVVGSESN